MHAHNAVRQKCNVLRVEIDWILFLLSGVLVGVRPTPLALHSSAFDVFASTSHAMHSLGRWHLMIVSLPGAQEGEAPKFDTETAVRVCRAAGYYEHALYVALQADEHTWWAPSCLAPAPCFLGSALAWVPVGSRAVAALTSPLLFPLRLCGLTDMLLLPGTWTCWWRTARSTRRRWRTSTGCPACRPQRRCRSTARCW